MRRPTLWIATLLAVALFASACSSGDDGGSSDDGQADDGGESSGSASAQGVTDDTIKLGFTYIDLSAISEITGLDHGPYDQQMQALVDDLNANRGIGGRQVELVARGYDPLEAESSQAVCLELTEDHEVFAVLGGMRGDQVLCYTEQHETIAIADEFMTDERQERAAAPYATSSAADDRILTGFIEEASAEGLFDGLRVAVHATAPADHATATDVVIPALEEAGVEVVSESLLSPGDGDVGGAQEEASVRIAAMQEADVDAVFVVGESILMATTLDAEGFFPTLFLGDMGTALGVAADVDLSVFPDVYTFGGFTNTGRYEEETFQDECVSVWDAAHPDDPVVPPNDLDDGDPNHTVGLSLACRTLTLFRLAAEAASDDLNAATFQEGLDSVGEYLSPGHGPASVSPDKYDAQDDLLLYLFDPDSATDERGFALYEG